MSNDPRKPLDSAADAARVFVLIPCAGQGSRAGTRGTNGLAKQYQAINGRPMVIHTVEAFRALPLLIAGLWLVISPGDQDFEEVFPGFGEEGEVLLPKGGATRADTVLNGLTAMLESGHAAPGDWVLVHDAARCLITPAQISALVAACQNDPVGGLLAQPLADTLKAESAGRVAATLDRTHKWLAQTPQMFRIGMLVQALKQAVSQAVVVTDEASAIEAMGLAPLLVAGSAQNVKVTYPEDFALADAIFHSRGI